MKYKNIHKSNRCDNRRYSPVLVVLFPTTLILKKVLVQIFEGLHRGLEDEIGLRDLRIHLLELEGPSHEAAAAVRSNLESWLEGLVQVHHLSVYHAVRNQLIHVVGHIDLFLRECN